MQRNTMKTSCGSYSEKCAVGIAAVWIGFYTFIGLSAMVGHGASAVAALQ
jgi:hypothetical protein